MLLALLKTDAADECNTTWTVGSPSFREREEGLEDIALFYVVNSASIHYL